jgi:hypothetical protein
LKFFEKNEGGYTQIQSSLNKWGQY